MRIGGKAFSVPKVFYFGLREITTVLEKGGGFTLEAEKVSCTPLDSHKGSWNRKIPVSPLIKS